MVLFQEARAQLTVYTDLGGKPEGIRIRLLGGFQVSVGTKRIIAENRWRLKKAGGLVKLLALAPSHRMHRERMMDLLWPTSDVNKAANSLRYTLHNARRILEPAPESASRYLHLRGEELVLCSEGQLWVDAEAFEEAAAEARRVCKPVAYQAAIELYAGELLPGDLYEEWAEGRREGLRQSFLSLLVELSWLYEERKEYGPAMEALRRAAEEEPTHEEAQVGLMRLQALSGRQGEAMRQYGRLEEVLSRKLSTEPSVASLCLYKEIKAGRFPLAHPPPAGPPPEEPVAAAGHNLPANRTSFVGRERELIEVKRALSMTRLLTLTGAGGSGKTRLATEVAREMVASYPDGVWLVELTGLSEEALVPEAVAAALGVTEQPGRYLVDVLCEALSKKRMLLVLDNCEHLIDAASRLVDTLLDSCPQARVLATSRQALGVAGEVAWPVPSLAVPDPGDATTEDLERCESARLFVERALQRRPGFALTPVNARDVAEVCRRLDGIPLAIELAAARAGVLSVEQIAERLNDCFRLLTAGSRIAVPRHRTLRTTIDCSHGLLSEDERRLFRRLAVFAGGFTLAAVEAICSGEDLERDEVLDLLSRLVDKSLVVVQEWGGEMRYRLLEIVRQYGWEKLEQSDEAKAIYRRHADFFLILAREVEAKIDPKVNIVDRHPWLERLEVEHDNFKAALRWAVDTDEAETGMRLAGALFWFWHMRGYSSEGHSWFERLLDEAPERTAVRAEAFYYAGYLACIRGHYTVARSQLEESVAIWREIGGRQGGLAHALWLLGLVMLDQGEPAVARSLTEESVEAFRTIEGDEFGLSMSLAILGIVVSNQGDHALASFLLEESLAISRKAGDNWALSLPLRYLGAAAFRWGDYDRAVVLLKESLTVLEESWEKWYVAHSLECLAAVVSMQGHHGRAARLFGAGEALREAIGASEAPFYLVDYERSMTATRAGLGEEGFSAAWAEGRAMALEEVIGYALSKEDAAPPVSPVAEETLAGRCLSTLTHREEEIALLIVEGLTNRQIAQVLVMSKRTVDNHVGSILKKLGLRSRRQVTNSIALAATTRS